MVDDAVDHAHRVRVLGAVDVAEEEDLARELLADLARQVGRAEAAVEAADVGVGLLEPGVLAAGQGEVADHVQAVPAPAAQPLTRQMTTFGMKRIRRWHSRMCSRASLAASTVSAVSPSAYW